MKFKIISKSYKETIKLASFLSSYLQKGNVITATGDLGSGKTCFAKGLGEGFKIKETITSPTFNIVRCYFNSKMNFYHIDAYRLEDAYSDIGLEEYIYGDGVTFVEWPNFISNILPKDKIELDIKQIDDDARELCFIVPEINEYLKFIEGVKKWLNN